MGLNTEFYIWHTGVLLTLLLLVFVIHSKQKPTNVYESVLRESATWMVVSALLAALLLCGFLRAQLQLLPGSCNFELGTCGYTSDPEYGSWSMNEEGSVIMNSAY